MVVSVVKCQKKRPLEAVSYVSRGLDVGRNVHVEASCLDDVFHSF